MRIAQQKLESNIAEYILYMYQIEDLIRGFNFDLEAICHQMVFPVIEDEAERLAYQNWYEGLIKDLKLQGKKEKGHLNDLEEIKMELFYLHTSLISMLNDEVYKKAFAEAHPFIKEYQQKSGAANLNEIDSCFNALYAKLLLRLKKTEISKETEEAFAKITEVVKLLTKSYHKMKRGDLNYINN